MFDLEACKVETHSAYKAKSLFKTFFNINILEK